jgi:hypothetical protein
VKQIVIKAAEGLVEVSTPRGSATGRTLEAALEKVDPGADPTDTHICARRLEPLLADPGHIQVHEGLADA